MTDYPVNTTRAARAERNDTRVTGPVAAGRRFLIKAISGLLGPVQRARQTQLAALPTPPGSIVFLGDSITEGGEWSEWFTGIPVINRGVSGEVSGQVLARIAGAINDPKAVLLLIGTNDIARAVPTSEIVDNVRAILNSIDRLAPGTPVIVQSIMPRALAFREEVRHVNTLLREVVASAGDRVRWVDLWPALATAEGTLRPEFTEDKLHLNGAGYAAWVDVIRPLVEGSR